MSSIDKTLDLSTITTPALMAVGIGNKWTDWNGLRSSWLAEKQELRNYVFATDTTKTSNRFLPWKNSTTIPKLCQIRDNLHANYIAALFANSEWLEWEGSDQDSVAKDKAQVIKAFMYNKIRASDFETTVSRLLLDWIDYGNAFATVEFINESRTNKATGEEFPGYVGPKLVRISPFDIVFNPLAGDFEHTPKIIRTVKSIGELAKEVNSFPDNAEAKAAFQKALDVRGTIKGMSENDIKKDNGFQIDGFSSLTNYYNSGMVEILTFYGDLFDEEKQELLENYEIKIIDRSHVLYSRPNANWLGRDHFYHVGWRLRPDNLYAMGPLDNLVGMQYRIDHLENLKADAFDMIAFPMMKIRGEVQNFDYAPHSRIYVGDEGDVDFMHPDPAALQANNEIAIIEQKMEDMAGAPKQAMGIRTPGEKTAFEVQSLENASGRIFQNKTVYFEKAFLVKILNAMLDIGVRNLDTPELIQTLDTDIDVAIFKTITKEDLKASGKLRPVGASHFSQQALLTQNLVQLLNSAIGQDPAINVHLSGKQLAKAAEDILKLERFSLFSDNVRVIEQMETQRLVNEGQEQLQVEQATPPGTVPGDMAAGGGGGGNVVQIPQPA